jgi:hypothetical protein
VQKILRDRMRACLASTSQAVLTVSVDATVLALPVRYRADGLLQHCLVPRWSDIAYHAGLHPEGVPAVLSILLGASGRMRWLQCTGRARPVAEPDWSGLLPADFAPDLAADVYLVLQTEPQRIDLLDEHHGWGARETLEIDGGPW